MILAMNLATPARPVMLALLLATCACAAGERAASRSAPRASVTMLSPRCAGVRSCLVGHVTGSGSSAPVAKAAVFLEREPEDGDDPGAEPLRILALTDEQGVFVVEQPPPGSYRLAVYKDDSSVEVAGLELGREGTTLLPIRLGAAQEP